MTQAITQSNRWNQLNIQMNEYCIDEPGFANGCGQLSQCLLQSSGLYECHHDSAFEPNAYVGIIYALMPPFVGIAVLGGLGGGILKGPFIQVLLNYPQTEATHLSYCVMLGASLLNTVLLFCETHPQDKNRPIITFDVAVIQNLAIPFATYIGASLADFIPQLYSIIFQIIFLIFACYIVWGKAVSQRELEKKAKAQQSNKVSDGRDIQQETNQEIIAFDKYRNDKFPLMSMLIILFGFVFNQVLFLMRSQGEARSIIGVKECTITNSLLYVILIAANVLYTGLIWLYGRRIEFRKDNIQYRPDERYYTPITKFLLIYAGGFAGGFISGFLGLGPGLVIVPVLIQSGLIARVATSTSAFSQFWIGMNNLTTLLTQHLLKPNEIALFTILGLLGGSIFSKIGYYYMNRYKIGYIVIFFVFWLAISNIFSSIYYGVISGLRYSIDYLTQLSDQC